MLHAAGTSEAEAHAYLKRWGLMTPALAAHVIRFLTAPTSRTYVLNYPAGRELARSYVAPEPERFRRLLTDQVRARDLLEAREAARSWAYAQRLYRFPTRPLALERPRCGAPPAPHG